MLTIRKKKKAVWDVFFFVRISHSHRCFISLHQFCYRLIFVSTFGSHYESILKDFPRWRIVSQPNKTFLSEQNFSTVLPLFTRSNQSQNCNSHDAIVHWLRVLSCKIQLLFCRSQFSCIFATFEELTFLLIFAMEIWFCSWFLASFTTKNLYPKIGNPRMNVKILTFPPRFRHSHHYCPPPSPQTSFGRRRKKWCR